MKAFVRENWYKLLIGLSMLIAATGFLIFTISKTSNNSSNNSSKENYPYTKEGFAEWVYSRGYTNPDFNGLWYMDNTGTDRQAKYINKTFIP
jgi:hypothetical protein